MQPPKPGTGPTKKTRRAVPEEAVRRAVLAYLKSCAPAVCFCSVPGGIFKRGAPDLLLCVRGRFVALELKRPGGELTELQAESLRMIRAAGGIAEVVHSADEARALIEPHLT